MTIAGTISVIQGFNIGNATIPWFTFLGMLGFMILLYVFSNALKSKDKIFRISGYILIYSAVIIASSFSIVFVYAIITDEPEDFANWIKGRKNKEVEISGLIKIAGNIPHNDSIGYSKDSIIVTKAPFAYNGSYVLHLYLKSKEEFQTKGTVSLVLLKDTSMHLINIDLRDSTTVSAFLEPTFMKFVIREMDLDLILNIAKIKDINGEVKTLKIERISVKKPQTYESQESKDTVLFPSKPTELTKKAKEKIENPPAEVNETETEENKPKFEEVPNTTKIDPPKTETENVKPPIDVGPDKTIEYKKKSVYEVYEVEEKPVPVNLTQVTSLFSQQAKAREIKGTVSVKVLVGLDGRPTKVNIIKCPDDFEDEVEMNAMNLMFSIPKINGSPVKCWYQLKFDLR